MRDMKTAYYKGWLTIREVENDLLEPVRRITYWPVSQGSEAWLRDMDYLNKEATYDGNGCYQIRIAPYVYRPCNLAEYGQTRSLAVETEPIPAPKVRKGIETRYRDGRWQKYLRSEGWVNA